VIRKLKILLGTIPLALTIGVTVYAQDSTSRKFDEFIGELDEEDLMARLDSFANELKNRPDAQGYIIVYRTRHDAAAISQRHAHRAKDYLVRVRHIAGNRIVTVDGGMTGCLTYELWIVPPGASPPERRFTYKYSLGRLNTGHRRRT